MPITSRGPTRWHELRGSRLGSWIGFAGAACSLVAVFAASASPIPLYEMYRRTDGLSHADLSLTAVAYFVAVMAALVVLGRLSNHLGRRPVALAALVVTAVGTLVLTQVHSVGPLIAGRMLQGIGCGLASSALAAFIVDSAPTSPSWMASAVTTGSPMVGLTLGALVSGALAEYGPAPRTLVYLVAAGVLFACVILIVAATETVARAPGARAALRPQVRVPAAARRLLPAASATFVATWALGGFYQAFGPSVAADQLGTTNTLIAAVIFASLMAPSAIGAPLAGRTTPAGAQRIGIFVFFAAVVAILLSLHAGAVVPFVIASAVAGAAQGTTFAGSMRALLAEATAAERAGVLSAIYLISYGGAAIPGVIAGQLSRTLSLFDIALGYGALAALACAFTLVAARDPRPTAPADLATA
jgi:predicted MFS family arabinose efflux permease